MLEPIKFNQSEIDLQDAIMEVAVSNVIKLTPNWTDICLAAARLYLTTCDMLNGTIPEIRFSHNGKSTRLEYRLKEVEGTEEFEADAADIEKQKAILDAMFDTAEKSEDGFSYGDLLICSGRLFMIGYDGLAGTKDVLKFRHNKKNFTMHLVEAK